MSQTFTELLAAADGTRTTAGETSEGPQAPSSSLNLSVPETWQQGRAIFGGLTAAICLDAATPFAGNRPLRTAQITFIGPASGQLTATASPVRLGKNTAFVAVTLTNDLGIAASAMLVFGQARSSQHSVQRLTPPASPDPDDCGSFIRPDGPRPVGFWDNFETRPAQAQDAAMIGNPDYDGQLKMWLRHRDPAVHERTGGVAGTLDARAVLALADVPPPAAMPSFSEPTPVSSMTWMAEFLTESVTTSDGWLLAHHTDEFANNGYSSQSMILYNTDRQPVVVSRQSVAVFG